MRRMGIVTAVVAACLNGLASGQDTFQANPGDLVGLLGRPKSTGRFWSAAPGDVQAATAGGLVSLGAHPLTAGWAQLALGEREQAGERDLPVAIGVSGDLITFSGSGGHGP